MAVMAADGKRWFSYRVEGTGRKRKFSHRGTQEKKSLNTDYADYADFLKG